MVLIILAIWFGYKKARDTGRNKFLWAAIAGGVFLGVQILGGHCFRILDSYWAGGVGLERRGV